MGATVGSEGDGMSVCAAIITAAGETMAAADPEATKTGSIGVVVVVLLLEGGGYDVVVGEDAAEAYDSAKSWAAVISAEARDRALGERARTNLLLLLFCVFV